MRKCLTLALVVVTGAQITAAQLMPQPYNIFYRVRDASGKCLTRDQLKQHVRHRSSFPGGGKTSMSSGACALDGRQDDGAGIVHLSKIPKQSRSYHEIEVKLNAQSMILKFRNIPTGSYQVDSLNFSPGTYELDFLKVDMLKGSHIAAQNWRKIESLR